MSTDAAKRSLLQWYRENRRELPWRQNRDPYRIWISETMLQQTTTTAVIPYFERFVLRFSTLQALAAAPLPDVLEAWAGLGYYSRARNLHRAAQALAANGGFPHSHVQLAEYPGFGPYTSRSVASLAFDEPVGVVDGNVIRVLARFEAADWQWWKTSDRAVIQSHADAWVQGLPSSQMNQALMELGRTICTPKSPSCLLCPIQRQCQSSKDGQALQRPQARPRREREIWLWEPVICVRGKKLLLRQNDDIPFLRGQWLLPGTARQAARKPKQFDYRHSITHHDIYVTVRQAELKLKPTDKWIELKEYRKHVPASLVQKALARMADSTNSY
jgi:A/G-specific adenine glycosylase